MATTVYEVEEIELQDGQTVSVKPLDIKRLREFMAVIDEMNNFIKEKRDKKEEIGELDTLDFLIRATQVVVKKDLPDFAGDEGLEKLEEVLDIPTIWKIMEGAGGIAPDPNQLAGIAE